MKLSEHFTKEEFEFSSTAIRLGINNKLPDELLPAATALHEVILEPLRDKIGAPIHEDSGYRCIEVNRAVGSKDDSQHVLAEAADIKVKGLKPSEVADFIDAMGLPYDQLIEEYGDEGWCHVSFGPRNRRMRFKKP
jgi:zinc D-Ala-D-Ala carboxypeptidase